MSHRSASGDEASAGFDDLGSADLWWQLLQARGLKDLWWPLLMGVWLHSSDASEFEEHNWA